MNVVQNIAQKLVIHLRQRMQRSVCVPQRSTGVTQSERLILNTKHLRVTQPESISCGGVP